MLLKLNPITRHKINYTVYEYKQKIKNKYKSFEDIIQKKEIETYYEILTIMEKELYIRIN